MKQGVFVNSIPLYFWIWLYNKGKFLDQVLGFVNENNKNGFFVNEREKNIHKNPLSHDW